MRRTLGEVVWVSATDQALALWQSALLWCRAIRTPLMPRAACNVWLHGQSSAKPTRLHSDLCGLDSDNPLREGGENETSEVRPCCCGSSVSGSHVQCWLICLSGTPFKLQAPQKKDARLSAEVGLHAGLGLKESRTACRSRRLQP